MESETSRQILEEVDGLLTAIGQTDYESLREAMQKASTLAINLGRHLRVAASFSKDDVAALVHQNSQPEQERILRLLIGLRETLPMIAPLLTQALQFLPPDRGGRPKSFPNREKMRQVCDLVYERMDKGDRESKAKRFAAKKLGFSYQTIHRYWEKRIELREQSFEEFITPLIKSLSVNGETTISGRSNLMKSTQETVVSPPKFKEVKQQNPAPSDDKIGEK